MPMISVLYVDDQKELLDIGKLFLERTGEFHTDICSSPHNAITLMNAQHYDAIISDYEMPGMDGLELLKTIRAAGNTIPFIIFTGKGREEVVIEALNNGADFYLQKGGDPKSQFVELIHKVKQAIQGRRSEQEIIHQIQLIKRIAEISTKMMMSAPDMLNTVILESLEEIGNLCRAERCYLVQWDSPEKTAISITHEWCANGVYERSSHLQHESSDLFTWYFDQLSQNNCIHIRQMSDIPDTEQFVHEHVQKYQIKSFLQVPLFIGDSLTGVLSLDAVFHEISWAEEEMDILRIFGQAMVNAIVRKKNFNDLTESEARYRSVVESQTEFICRYKPDGTHLFVNDAYCRYFNQSKGYIIGRRFIPVIPPEEKRELYEYFQSLTPQNPDGFIEHRIILPDGSIRWHQWTDHALFDENEICIEYQSVGRDITDRKKVEINLAKSEELYRTVFESTGTAMMILDADKTILSVNHEMLRMSGYSRSEVENKLPWTAFVAPEFVEMMTRYHQERRQLNKKTPTQYEFTFLTRGNTRIDSLITVGMIPETNRSIVSIIDISRLTATKKALLESEEKFRKLAESLTLGVYMIQGDRFIYANPYITSIFGYSEEEIYSHSIFSLFLESDKKIIQNAIQERIEGREGSAHYRVCAKAKNGEVLTIEIEGSITHYLDKPAIIGILRKIGD